MVIHHRAGVRSPVPSNIWLRQEADIPKKSFARVASLYGLMMSGTITVRCVNESP